MATYTTTIYVDVCTDFFIKDRDGYTAPLNSRYAVNVTLKTDSGDRENPPTENISYEIDGGDDLKDDVKDRILDAVKEYVSCNDINWD